MKTFPQAFAAMALIAVMGLVGCGKTETGKTGEKTDAKTGEKTMEPAKAEQPNKTKPANDEEPKKVEPMPTQNNTTPSNQGAEAEAGSTEKKGGVDIPNEAEAGSTEKKGGVDIPNE
jgi:hypothetical protein